MEQADVQEMRAWEQYARREKRKIRCLYIVLAVLTAVCLLGFLLALDGNWNAAAFICGIGCVLAGGGLCFKLADPRIRDWKKQSPVSAQAVVLEKKIRISGGGSAAGYPCIVVRMVGDQKKILDTLSWEVYDSLFPGDQIRIRYQGFVLLEYRMLYQGPVSKAASRRREAEGQFIKRYIKTVARWRHFPVAEFQLAGGEKLTLRVSEEWESPKAEDTGTLRWHGEILDDFEILES